MLKASAKQIAPASVMSKLSLFHFCADVCNSSDFKRYFQSEQR